MRFARHQPGGESQGKWDDVKVIWTEKGDGAGVCPFPASVCHGIGASHMLYAGGCPDTGPEMESQMGGFVISLYADDMLLYLADPLQSIPRALKILDIFVKYSGSALSLWHSQ